MHSLFDGYGQFGGECPSRFTGSIVADRRRKVVPYALLNLEPHGRLFITPGDPVHESVIGGEHNRGVHIDVNPCKEKKLSNMRAAGRDDNVILFPIKRIMLGQTISFISKTSW